MFIPETNSTNDLLKQQTAEGIAKEWDWIATDYQSAGRGQAGNSWESERGMNLLFSVLLCPKEVPVEKQFRLSMLVSLAVVNVLNGLGLPDKANKPLSFSIKWPNDIYCGDKKLGGILIENQLQGSHISSSVVGVGLNVNQTVFHSDAPNPVSLKTLSGKEHNREELVNLILNEMKRLLPTLAATQDSDTLREAYWNACYRHTGFYPYVEREVSSAPTSIAESGTKGAFEAQMVGITDSGELQLQLRTGEKRTYHFKQIRFVINH